MHVDMAKIVVFFLAFVVVLRKAHSCTEYGAQEASSCTSGFASLLHIDKLANNKRETEDMRQVVIPDITFACNGSITSTIVGAKWKGGSVYTELQIWRKHSSNVYMKVNGSNIIAASENSSEVYELVLSPPLYFQYGDILGYFQPHKDGSQLDLYLEKSDRITTYYTESEDPFGTGELFNLSITDTSSVDVYPLMAVETDPPGCGCEFLSVKTVYTLLDVSPFDTGGMRKDFDNVQIIFPDITFTCSGEVVKWIMAGKWNAGKSEHPELQIWRLKEGTTYERLNGTVIEPADREYDEVYEYPVDPPLQFQQGDILGVLQPQKGDSELQVRYDNGGDSVYYYTAAGGNYDLFDTSGAQFKTDLPLITVDIIKYTSLPLLLPSSPLDLIPTSAPDIRGSMTDIRPSNTRPITSSTVIENLVSISPTQSGRGDSLSSTSSMDTNSPLPPLLPPSQSPTVATNGEESPSLDSGGLSSGAVVGLVFSLIISLLLTAIIAVITITILAHKRKTYTLNMKTEVGMSNPTYGDVVTDRSSKSIEMYALPSNENDASVYALPDVPQHYEMPIPKTLETSEKWGIYVPTVDQREVYQEVDDIYSYPDIKAVCDGGSGADDDGERETFFTESDIYWVPASSSTELYEQLSKYRFREIQRSQIKAEEHLGAGQFGTVSKGVWQCPRGPRDVAIKVLQSGAAEDSQVRFLKEAAIMGQFSHPNIISLLGVVTLGEPVMIVMELMENGDLRGNLIKMRPIPGEMPPVSLYQLLLDFCHQISTGMTYLTEKAFVHRDIAARNILLSGKACKIADFGMARDLVDSDYYTSHGGQIPVKWTAPEALHYKKYSTASDVWSFGCLMYEIWSLGHKPFEDYTNAQVVGMVMTGWRLPPPPGCPREMYRLMICCWNPEPTQRPQFSHLLQTLSQPEHELLLIPEEVKSRHPQASMLGTPLEVAMDIYTDLQNIYITTA